MSHECGEPCGPDSSCPYCAGLERESSVVEFESEAGGGFDPYFNSREDADGLSEFGDGTEEECAEPCPPGTDCAPCQEYWSRMEAEGLWKDGAWTDRGFREIVRKA